MDSPSVKEPNHDSNDEAQLDIDQQATRQKRSGACVSCRNAKIRCIFPERRGGGGGGGGGGASCKACLKNARPCLVQGPSKPRFKTTQKFTELEKKVETLTSALAAKSRQDSQTASTRSSTQQASIDLGGVGASSITNRLDPDVIVPTLTKFPSSYNTSQNYTDAIDQGLLDVQTAAILYNHWNMNMRPLLPIIAFGPNVSAEQLRFSRPILFLAILVVASTSVRSEIHPRLAGELNEQLARLIMILGSQSVELVQATLLFSQYYVPPQNNNFALTQHVHAAVSMSTDLRMDKVAMAKKTENHYEAMNVHRAWLGTYHAASASSVLLHRSILISPDYTVEHALKAISSNQEKDPYDTWLCDMVRLQQIVEEASMAFKQSDWQSENALDEPMIQYRITALERQLKSWEQSVQPTIDLRLTKYAYLFANLMIHHVAMRNYKYRQFEAWAKEDQNNHNKIMLPLTHKHFDLLCLCLKSCHEILDIYISLELRLARSLPNIYLVWAMHAAVGLVKMSYFIETLTNYDFPPTVSGPIISNSVLQHLNSMTTKIAEVCNNGSAPQARAFGFVFQKIKLWYANKRDVCINSQAEYCSTGGPYHDILQTVQAISSHNANNITSDALYAGDDADVSPPYQGVTQTGYLYVPPQHQTHMNTMQYPPSVQQLQFASSNPTQTSTAPGMATMTAMPQERADWADLDLDPDAMKELDSYMMDENDAWTSYLL